MQCNARLFLTTFLNLLSEFFRNNKTQNITVKPQSSHTSNGIVPTEAMNVVQQLPRSRPNLSVVKRQEIKEKGMSLSQMCLSVTKEAVARHKQLSLSQGDSPVANRVAIESNSVSPNQRNGLVAKQPDVHQRRGVRQSQCNAESPVAIETDLLSSRSSNPVAEGPATHLKCLPLSQRSNPVCKQTVVDLTDLPSSPKEVKLSRIRSRSPVAKQLDVEPKGLSSSEGGNSASKQSVSKQRFLHGQGEPRSPRQDADLSIEGHLTWSQGNSPVTKEPVSKAQRLSLSQGNSPIARQPVNIQRFLLGQGVTKSPRQDADLPVERHLPSSRGNSPVTKEPVSKAHRLSLSQENSPIAKQPVNIQRFLLDQGVTKSPRQDADLPVERHLPSSRGNSHVTKEPVSKARRLSLSQENSPIAKQPVNIQRFLLDQGVTKSPRQDADLPIERHLPSSRGNSPVTKELVSKAHRLSLSQGNSPVTKQRVNIQRFLLGHGVTKNPRQDADQSIGRHLSMSQGNNPVTKEPVTKAKRLSLSQVAKGRRSLNKGNNSSVAKRPVPKIKRLSSSQEKGQKFKQKSLLQYDFIIPPKGKNLVPTVLAFESTSISLWI